jgi:zinc protease
MSDVVRNPSFPPGDIERVRQQRLVSLSQATDDPDAIADKVMRREIYGAGHPYGHSADGDEQSLRAINRDDLVKFHQQAFSPRNSALVLAGDLTVDAARKLAEDAFGGWTGSGANGPGVDTARPGTPIPGPDRVLVVDRPGSAQTNLVLSQPGVARSDPDYEKLLVMNEVLGGGSASRVNINLRERHGYTYGAFSRLGRNRGISTFSLLSSVQTQFTGPSVSELLNEVRGIQNAPITPEELNRAKESIIRSLPATFVTGSDAASAIGRLDLYDLPPDYYQALPARLTNIDAAGVQEAAKAHLRPDEMKVVAVGDRAKIEPQLATLNLGPIAGRKPDASPAP